VKIYNYNINRILNSINKLNLLDKRKSKKEIKRKVKYNRLSKFYFVLLSMNQKN